MWQTTPPEKALTAYLAIGTATAHAAYPLTRPTIEDVLRTLGPGIPPDIEPVQAQDDRTDTAEADAEPFAQEEVPETLPPAKAVAEAPAPHRLPDFMDDDAALGEEFWDGQAGGAGPVRPDAPSPLKTISANPMAALAEHPRSSKATR